LALSWTYHRLSGAPSQGDIPGIPSLTRPYQRDAKTINEWTLRFILSVPLVGSGGDDASSIDDRLAGSIFNSEDAHQVLYTLEASRLRQGMVTIVRSVSNQFFSIIKAEVGRTEHRRQLGRMGSEQPIPRLASQVQHQSGFLGHDHGGLLVDRGRIIVAPGLEVKQAPMDSTRPRQGDAKLQDESPLESERTVPLVGSGGLSVVIHEAPDGIHHR
jgi:hypothetical protein